MHNTDCHIILGIDPGSRITGFGLIKSTGLKHQYITSGCIRVKAEHFSERLEQIFAGVREIVQRYQPTTAAIEQVFMHRNPGAALKLGQARGAAMVALTADKHLAIAEYSARQIKQAIVGYGAADKQQMQHMTKVLLCLSDTPQADAADALAIAICHAQVQHTNKALLR